MQQVFNQRVAYLDWLRLLATLAVILLHVCGEEFCVFSFSRNWYISLTYDSLVRWCVPVFVMISGALFLDPQKEITYQDIFKNRIPRLLIAYVFWSIIYALLGFITTSFNDFSITELVRRIVVSHFHLWFLPMLMGVYLLIPILIKIADDKKSMQYALVIWIAFVGISFLDFVSVLKTAWHFGFLFNINTVVGFSGYFLLGYYLSQQDFSKKQKFWVYLFGILGALVTIAGTLYFSIKKGVATERFFNYLSIQVVAMSAAVFVSMKSIVPKFGNIVVKITNCVRKDLFGVYLIHVFWLPIVNAVVFRHCCSEIITLPLITIIVLILSLITTKLIRLVPFLRKVVE